MTRRTKLQRTTEVIAAWAALTLMAPLFLLIAVAIKVTSKGPIFQRRERLGRHGKRISLWKFRTVAQQMSPVAQPGTDPVGRRSFTAIGSLLERLSIAETPRLYSVACGDLHLVGPRPTPFARLAGRPYLADASELTERPGLIGARSRT